MDGSTGNQLPDRAVPHTRQAMSMAGGTGNGSSRAHVWSFRYAGDSRMLTSGDMYAYYIYDERNP